MGNVFVSHSCTVMVADALYKATFAVLFTFPPFQTC